MSTNKEFEKLATKYSLTVKEVAHLHDTFDLIDENGDNSLSQTEIQHAMIMLGHHVSHKSLKTIVEAVNGGKDLSFSDFVAINAARMKRKKRREQFKELFEKFDKDHSGKINAKEMKKAWARLGEKITLVEAKAMVAEVDHDGDGEVDFEEFKELWKHL